MAVTNRRAAFAEESAEVEVLYANVDKMKSLTKKIQSSMTRLETSGKTVQDAIGPIYGNTQKLQTTNSNIDRIILAIDRIREPLDMRNKEERVIRASPQRVGLAEYMASVDRTRQALRDMKQTNLRSNQTAISELHSLLRVGSQQLEEAFKEILRDGQQPVEPLHFITKNVDFPRLQSSKTSQLRAINTHVASTAAETAQSDARTTPSAKAYADVRGPYITSSLQNLATASIATARKQNADAMYKRGDNAIGTYAAGLLGMYTAEYDNICPIFAREEWSDVLSLTCSSSLNAFAATLRDLDKHIRDNMISDCYLAYEIIEVVTNTSMQLESKTGDLKRLLSDALKPLRETAKSSLALLLTDVRSKVGQMMQMPTDGSALPYTSEVMTRLQVMTGYLAPLSSVMTSLGDGGWSAPTAASSSSVPTLKSFDVGPDSRLLFAHYASDMIEILLSNLETRSRMTLKSKGAQGVFLGNNIAVIDRMIRSSELQPLLGSAQATKLETWRKKAVSLYVDPWREPALMLLDQTITNKGPRPPSTGANIDSATWLKGLSSKDKDSVKEKFKSFNPSFDDLVAKHNSFKMEKSVRSEFAKAIQQLLEALYLRFWEKYHEIDKGKGKYVKYDKNQFIAIVASLG